MKKKYVSPNGGWGWMVVIGAALINMVNQSLFSSFGLIYGDKLKEMGYGTVGAALIINLNSMITNFSGLITGPLLKAYSNRKIALVGVVLTATGIILSSATTNITHLIISYSIFTGLGLGLIMPSTFVAVNGYFSTKKSQAVGYAMAGTGIGQMLMPQVVRFLLDEYGYQGTTLILGALCLNGLPGALLFQPVKKHMILVDVEENVETQHLLNKSTKPQKILLREIPNEDCQFKVQQKDKSVFIKLAELLNLELLNDFNFVHILIGLSLVYTCSVAFNMLLPFFLQDGIGLNRSNTALIMSLLSGADILSRITLPLATARFRISNRTTFLLGTLALAVSRSFLAEQVTFQVVLLTSILCGYTRAAVIINQNLTVSEYCTDQTKLPGALGLNMVTKGIIVLSIGQLIGWVRDYSQSFSICIHLQSIIMIIVAVSWSIEIIVTKYGRNSTKL